MRWPDRESRWTLRGWLVVVLFLLALLFGWDNVHLQESDRCRELRSAAEGGGAAPADARVYLRECQ